MTYDWHNEHGLSLFLGIDCVYDVYGTVKTKKKKKWQSQGPRLACHLLGSQCLSSVCELHIATDFIIIVILFSVPVEAPPNVRVEQLKNNEILVFWDPLPEMYANGEIRLYVVYLREWRHHYQSYDDDELARVVNAGSSDTQLFLSNLDGGRVYQVAVAAFTVDVGPLSDWEKFQVGKCALLLFYSST